jgi:hypothetical protein
MYLDCNAGLAQHDDSTPSILGMNANFDKHHGLSELKTKTKLVVNSQFVF